MYRTFFWTILKGVTAESCVTQKCSVCPLFGNQCGNNTWTLHLGTQAQQNVVRQKRKIDLLISNTLWKHVTTGPDLPLKVVFYSECNDRPGPCSQTGQRLFATDLLQVRLPAQQPWEPRAEDGDQVGDVGRVRVVLVGTFFKLCPFASRTEIRYLLNVAYATTELNLPFLGRGLRTLAALERVTAAVLVEVAVLHCGHHMRVQIKHCSFVAMHVVACRKWVTVWHMGSLHAAAAVVGGLRFFAAVLQRRASRERARCPGVRRASLARRAEQTSLLAEASSPSLLLIVGVLCLQVQRIQLLDLVADRHHLFVLLHPVDLCVFLLDVDLPGVSQHIGNQQVFVQLEPTSLRPGVVDLH